MCDEILSSYHGVGLSWWVINPEVPSSIPTSALARVWGQLKTNAPDESLKKGGNTKIVLCKFD